MKTGRFSEEQIISMLKRYEGADSVSDATVVGIITGLVANDPDELRSDAPTVWLTGLSGAGKSTLANLLPFACAEAEPKLKCSTETCYVPLCARTSDSAATIARRISAASVFFVSF